MSDSTVLVTGAGEGLGRGVATAFAAEGWTVVIGAETEDGLAETVAACEDEGASTTGIRANVRDEFDLERLAKTAAGFGPSAGIDAVVPAGEARHDEPGESPIEAASYAAFDDHWRANARGVFATILETLPHLTDDARILVPTTGSPNEVPAAAGSYGVSKAGAAAVARAFATDTEYAVGRIDPSPPSDEQETVGSLFVWAATAVDASDLDDARLSWADRAASPTDA